MEILWVATFRWMYKLLCSHPTTDPPTQMGNRNTMWIIYPSFQVSQDIIICRYLFSEVGILEREEESLDVLFVLMQVVLFFYFTIF